MKTVYFVMKRNKEGFVKLFEEQAPPYPPIQLQHFLGQLSFSPLSCHDWATTFNLKSTVVNDRPGNNLHNTATPSVRSREFVKNFCDETILKLKILVLCLSALYWLIQYNGLLYSWGRYSDSYIVGFTIHMHFLKLFVHLRYDICLDWGWNITQTKICLLNYFFILLLMNNILNIWHGISYVV